MISHTETAAPTAPRRRSPDPYIFFFAGFALLVILLHAPFLDLPFYWDEAGQFVPAALDLYQHGAWVPTSAAPNVHPPGVMAYLALVWHVFGFSIVATRVAMLVLAAAALLTVFLLAIRLCNDTGGAPAFTAVLLLLLSPLFYTQAMLAQLDMPAMLLTAGALLLFLEGRVGAAVVTSVVLVLVKETGIVAPLVFAGWLIAEKRYREALWFLALPAVALAVWLAVLLRATGHIFGNAEFARYNVAFAIHPLRILLAVARRFFYLLIENFHWIGWIAVFVAWRRTHVFRTRPWRIAATLFAAHILAVSVLGGAVLERYLMPVLPLVYIAFAAAWSTIGRLWTRASQAAVFAALIVFLFVNPPYPYPFENNLAMVDFVRLQKTAATFLERNLAGEKVTTAWPLSIELRRPSLGYVASRMPVTEVPGFTAADLSGVKPESVEVFVLFSRDWQSTWDPRRASLTRGLTRRVYGYAPQISPAELERRLGLKQVARWEERGQWIAVYRKGDAPQRRRDAEKTIL